MKYRKIMVFLFILLLTVSVGCVSSTGKSVRDRCMELCMEARQKGMNLSNGPCLSDNNPSWDVEGWVCDVAHSPRQYVDNLPSNQCREFREGKARHFVEVTPECKYIRSY